MSNDTKTVELEQELEKANEIVVLTDEDLAVIKDKANELDITDSQSIILFGSATQTDIADFSNTMLNQVKTKDSGYVGDMLSSLVNNLGQIDAKSLSETKGGLFNSLKSRAKRFIGQYEKLSTQIEDIVDKLEVAQQELLKDVELLDKLYIKNGDYIKELDVYIEAGKMCIKDAEDNIVPKLIEKAEASDDALDTQAARDMQANVEKLDKKVGDLQLSRMVAIQSMPQLRLVQKNDEVLVEKIQSSLLNTIPLWKNQMVIALTIVRQNAALKLQRDVTDTTNELLKKNAEMLKMGSIETAIEAERGIVELETLQQVNNDLIETVTEVIRIQQEGRTARANAEKEIANMEGQLKENLLRLQKEKKDLA